MLSAKQGNWYDAVLVWGLNPGPPALEVSTLHLGYRGGGKKHVIIRKNGLTDGSIATKDDILTIIGLYDFYKHGT